jgi:hypothetical protein
MASGRVLHSGRVEISFNGVTIGRMLGFQPSESFGMQMQYCIGTIFPYEGVALRFAGQFSCSAFMIEKDKLAEAGVPAGTTAAAVSSSIKDLLTKDGITVTVKDRVSGQPFVIIQGAKCDAHGLNVTANAVIMRNATFQYGPLGAMTVNEVPESTTGYDAPPARK